MQIHYRAIAWYVRRADRAMRNTFGEPLPVERIPEPKPGSALDQLADEVERSYRKNLWFWYPATFVFLSALILVDSVAEWWSRLTNRGEAHER